MLDFIKSEPVALNAVVQALVVLLSVFGLKLTPEQVAAVVVVAQFVFAYFTRKAVTPNHKVPDTVEFKP